MENPNLAPVSLDAYEAETVAALLKVGHCITPFGGRETIDTDTGASMAIASFFQKEFNEATNVGKGQAELFKLACDDIRNQVGLPTNRPVILPT